MEALMLALLLLAAVLASSVIDQLVPKISSPLIQILLGLGIALLASTQIKIELDDKLFLVLFIAPLLYDEAKNIDKGSLWRNRRPVVSLAIGLVVATALIVGFAVNWLVPSISLFAAFALGAALGPTDAVAVASLSKETSISARSKSILEGESLINDASGIVSFQFAIAAAVTGTFSLIDATADFLSSFFHDFAETFVPTLSRQHLHGSGHGHAGPECDCKLGTTNGKRLGLDLFAANLHFQMIDCFSFFCLFADTEQNRIIVTDSGCCRCLISTSCIHCNFFVPLRPFDIFIDFIITFGYPDLPAATDLPFCITC